MNLQIPISQMKKEGNWPLPWASAIGLIPEIAKLGDNIVGCELGVSYGFNLVHFLENLPNISKVYAIDPYMPYDDGPGGYVTQEAIDTVKRLVQINVEEYKDKVKFIFLPADEASQDIPNESLDYIFIDGDHSFEAVKKDMKHYYSKVKPSGIFAGHDYHFSEVQKAVEQFRKENNISAELKTCANCVWYWYKGSNGSSMSDNVTIVTAFMDIGRENWTGIKNNRAIPSYIKRDTKTYFERFERLCKVKNPIVVFTHSKYFEQLKQFREDLFLIAIDTVFEDHDHLVKSISAIQNDPAFIKFVDRPECPEYWSTEYAVIMNMKSFFVNYAVEQKIAESDTYAWIDFGYVRDDTFCPAGVEWKFNTEGKINLFAFDNIKDNILTKPIFDIVKTGEVFIQGCHVIAPKAEWTLLKQLVVTNLTKLLGVGLIDDDQTLLLMAYRAMPEKFKINYVPSTDDWFMIFRDHNHVGN